jgi:penicillin-binding protein 2
MASAPGFDPNLFVNGIAQEPFRQLNEDEKKPLFHKCVTGVYAPGSTFKMASPPSRQASKTIGPSAAAGASITAGARSIAGALAVTAA